MFYVIKDDKLFEYGNRVNAAWNCPECAKELPSVDVAYFIENQEKYAVRDGLLVDISEEAEYIAKHEAEEKVLRANQIKEELDILDIKCIRALREGGSDENGVLYLDKYQSEINKLREELNNLL